MNSPLGNGRTSTGGPMKLPPMLLLAAFFLSGLGLSGQAQAQLSLVCPCSVEKDRDTHVTIMAGIENSRTAATNELRVVLGAAASPRGASFISQLATVPHASIAGGMSSSSREFTVAYRFPGQHLVQRLRCGGQHPSHPCLAGIRCNGGRGRHGGLVDKRYCEAGSSRENSDGANSVKDGANPGEDGTALRR